MAGDFGFFSPGSYWPIGLAGAATMVGLALAFEQVWLVIVGVIGLMFAVGGLLFEYYIGGNRPCSSARRATAPQVESRTPSGAGSRCAVDPALAGVRRSAFATTGPS